jgi:excisionase family DNA binding protein
MGGASSDRAYLTPAQAARVLRVSPKTINRWANDGRIPCSGTFDGQRRFRSDVIAAVGSFMGLQGGNGSNRRS